MCTVSLIAQASDGYRIVCNRDESRTRPPAAAPRWHPIDGGTGRALWPMDMEAGGTWIAASERGLSLCLLNLNAGHIPDAGLPRQSRGLLLPELIGLESVEHAAERWLSRDLKGFAPCRMVGIDLEDPRILEASWDGRTSRVSWHSGVPACFVSSGLGDHLVAPRLSLFEHMVVRAGATPESQDAFHRHVWPDRPHLSVMMSRAAARTVSVTTLEVSRTGSPVHVHMAYEAVREQADPELAPTLHR